MPYQHVIARSAAIGTRIAADKTLPVGTRISNVPKLSAGLFVIREDALDNGSRYGLGGGNLYVIPGAARSIVASLKLDL